MFCYIRPIQDIFHNKFFPSTRVPGVADDPADFAERWRAGMVAELNMFRALMPHALMDGHISVKAMPPRGTLP